MQKSPPTSSNYDDTLEQIRQEYIAAREAGYPSEPEEWITRYPTYAAALTAFIMEYERAEAAGQSSQVRETPSPYAIAAVERALASLNRADKNLDDGAVREGDADERREKQS